MSHKHIGVTPKVRQRAMSFDVWERKFIPVKNHNAPDDCGGAFVTEFMYETYGADYQFVWQHNESNPRTVWTIVEGDSGAWYLIDGLHFVNRLGYVITQKPCNEENLEVKYL
jgi:hypothetical protein